MCGICGVVAPVTSRLRIDADLITRMRDVMRHRGPDGAGIHLAEGVGLGHRRLSIIDVAHGQQPMFSDDRSAVLVYNGEIFNHPDLMRTLEDNATVGRLGQADTIGLLDRNEAGRRVPIQLHVMRAFATDRVAYDPIASFEKQDSAPVRRRRVQACVAVVLSAKVIETRVSHPYAGVGLCRGLPSERR